MGILGDLVVRIAGDHSKLNKSIDQSHGKLSNFGKDMVKLGKDIALKVGVPLAALAVAGVNAFQKQEQAEMKLAAALKATGNQIGMTTRQLKKMASEMSNVTAIADETIIEAQGLMTTFTQISGTVFPDALKAAADMSAMFGQDMKQSVIQLGTALNDPIAGVGRLKRIGISFTETQREMIKSFVEAGDIMKAQRVILDELGVEFGGVAEKIGQSSSGMLKRFQNNMGDILEMVGGATLDLIGPMLETANKFLAENKVKIAAIFKNMPEIAIKAFSLVVKIIKKALSWEGLSGTLGAIGKGLFEVFKITFEKIPKMFMSILDFLLAPVKNFGAWVGSIFEKIFADIGNFFIDALNNIPFVDIKNIAVKEVEEIGTVWDRTMTDMGSAFGDYSKELEDGLVKIGKIAVTTGSELAKVFAPEVEEFTNAVDQIIENQIRLDEQIEKGESKKLEQQTQEKENLKETNTLIEEMTQKYAGMGMVVTGALDAMKEKNEDWKENLKEGMDDFSSKVTNAMNMLNDVFNTFFTIRETEIDNWYEKQKNAIERNIQNETEREKALEKLDEQYDKKQGDLKRKQFRLEKTGNIIQAIMSTAVAVVKALQLGPILGPIMAAITGALGAVQIALIASQPIPAFKEGVKDFTVPPGYDNDSYLMRASSGERVTVETPGQQRGGSAINLTVMVGNDVLYSGMLPASKDRKILIHKNAIVEA